MTDQPTRPVTEDERALLQHVSRWGSDGSPVRQSGRRWTWGPWRSVSGPPTTFATKREATEHLEAFLEVLRRALGEEARARALAEQDAREGLEPPQADDDAGYCSEPDCTAAASDGDRCGFHAQVEREAGEAS